jgi:hypothetical protein
MNGHFSLFFENGMIRYLCSKVNLWEGKYFFFMMEDKMIYQAECLENTPKKRDRLLFLEEGSEKGKKRKRRHKKWGQAQFSKLGIKDTA